MFSGVDAVEVDRYAWVLLIATLPSPISGQVCSTPAQLQEVVRIGSVDGAVTLNRVRDLEIGPTGDIYVAQEDVESISVFGPDGSVRPAIGRAGGGPGEFGAPPTRVVWLADTLVVAERSATHFLDKHGEELKRVRFRTRIPSESSTFVNGSPLADGTFLGVRYLNPPVRVFMEASTLPLRRFSASGAVIDTIAHLGHAMPPVGDAAFRREFENRRLEHPLAWFAHDSWLPAAVTADEASIVFVGRVSETPRATFQLVRIAINGDTIFSREIPFLPVEISRAESERMRDAFARRFAGVDSGEGASGRTARMYEAARDALAFPRFYPPARHILAGEDGTIWILREASPRPAGLWDVYGPNGELIRTVKIDRGRAGRLPWEPRIRLLAATGETVWGLTTDDLDVPYIHRFKVATSCQAGAPP